jgi:hypothetical protein
MGTGWAAGGTPGGRRRLGEVLVAGRVLTETQLDEALRVQREDKGRRRRLGEVIVALGLADEIQRSCSASTRTRSTPAGCARAPAAASAPRPATRAGWACSRSSG